MQIDGNPLLNETSEVKTVDLAELEGATVHVRERRKPNARRMLADLRRGQSAREAIAPLTKRNQLYGFTKGQFSMLDLLVACLEKTGPASMILSTWTANPKEIKALAELVTAGKLLETKWLVDFTFVRRDPQAAHAIRTAFGLDAIRIASSHAKFAVFSNDGWELVVRTSMNLNMNPRFEDFHIAHDPDLAAFLKAIIAEIWTKQRATLGDDTTRAEAFRFWRDEL